VAKVEHAKGTPEDGAQTMIEALRPAVAGAPHEVVGYLVQPVGQRLAEPLQRLEPQRPGLLHPALQAFLSTFPILNALVLA